MQKVIIKSSVELTREQKLKLETGLNKVASDIDYIIDEELIGGIAIIDGDKTLDATALQDLVDMKRLTDKLVYESMSKGIAIKDIPNLLKERAKDIIDNKLDFKICGKVISAADGVVHIDGLNNCCYGELLLIGNDAFALAMNLTKDSIGAILLSSSSVGYGDTAYATGRIIEVPVGDTLLGRVVDPLGNALDARPAIRATQSRRIEFPAPGIVDRAKVKQSLSTGILAIDAMIPIGKGQRELIIGDRQTGKTSIAIDTIINQRDKDVICIYVAIGQRAAAVSKIARTLEERDALKHTIIVLSTASDAAPLQYIAPYTGAAIAEHFMYAGKDVLIVYDDLSKHAVAYRTISLLLKRPAGREAYPGDIFYIHSKLLERAAKLSPELGGGSTTALPIIETQAGDISAYIPTNVISITDGQIYLEGELFKAGQRPAVNVGLSVSRVGGAAQTKLMRLLSAQMRLEIAHYRELSVFAQFGSSLDDTTKEILVYGAKIVEAIKQPEYSPLGELQEEIYLYAIVNKALKNVTVNRVREFLEAYYKYVVAQAPEMCSEIERDGALNDVNEQLLKKLTSDFVSAFK
ncbi:MAG: F0F1 ATP synthase subunit alpha [Christensenellaceae bacterium]|jgi:F-type H+-transporting ATPase subunit alpha|nr:F0F1 ATP synthase subunit alpha [Christensenellaceae bacterium]